MDFTLLLLIAAITVSAISSRQRKRMKEMQEKYTEIKIGMTKDALINLLGQPASTGTAADGKATMKWKYHEFRGITAGNVERNITVDLENDLVVSFSGDALSA